MANYPQYITFFHHSDKYIEVFDPCDPKVEARRGYNRPMFYWFYDKYYHYWGDDYKDKYFYIFVKKPSKDVIFFEYLRRGRYPDFHKLWLQYLKRKEEEKTGCFTAEPPILISFSVIEPDLIAEYDKERDMYFVLKPSRRDKSEKVYLSFHDRDKKPVSFLDIGALVDLLPQIKYSVPFQQPLEIDGKYIYHDWRSCVRTYSSVFE